MKLFLLYNFSAQCLSRELHQLFPLEMLLITWRREHNSMLPFRHQAIITILEAMVAIRS